MWNPFSSRENLHQSWQTIQSVKELDDAIAESHLKPIILFKHSTSCSRSAFAKHRLESSYSLSPDAATFYYLDLLNHRDVSNAIAAELNVVHQSPQIILVKKGKAVFNTSHESISLRSIEERL